MTIIFWLFNKGHPTKLID